MFILENYDSLNGVVKKSKHKQKWIFFWRRFHILKKKEKKAAASMVALHLIHLIKFLTSDLRKCSQSLFLSNFPNSSFQNILKSTSLEKVSVKKT